MKHYVQISNPPAGFTVTFDEHADKFLGGYWTKIKVKAKVQEDRTVIVCIRPDSSSRHRIVKRSSANRNSTSRFVDRIEDFKKVFPVEFGPTLVQYTTNDKVLQFRVPRLEYLRPPITRLRKQTKKPLLDLRSPPKKEDPLFVMMKGVLDDNADLRKGVMEYLAENYAG